MWPLAMRRTVFLRLTECLKSIGILSLASPNLFSMLFARRSMAHPDRHPEIHGNFARHAYLEPYHISKARPILPHHSLNSPDGSQVHHSTEIILHLSAG